VFLKFFQSIKKDKFKYNLYFLKIRWLQKKL
jgi:hypothetical protein